MRRRVPIWVGRLKISPRTGQKIIQEHGLTPIEVREAVEAVAGLRALWDQDPVFGLRALIRTRIRDRPVLVVLYEWADPFGDTFSLASAYFID